MGYTRSCTMLTENMSNILDKIYDLLIYLT